MHCILRLEPAGKGKAFSGKKKAACRSARKRACFQAEMCFLRRACRRRKQICFYFTAAAAKLCEVFAAIKVLRSGHHGVFGELASLTYSWVGQLAAFSRMKERNSFCVEVRLPFRYRQ